ncbi:OmpP1/FadL family transporter [Brumimicrobium aurantiacum]|uniref:Aromatic hydrocarbon degradation protein n=1 Tax=Brumimicrobium aurantiacum TaxID=1737063 RepID=A0A3E1EZ46_9FLAO|nr:outer membrane protein transport protein [Brumimicrobium aurantiacum]RFC54826.1 hypothetical protein DXU93_07535 [Brumimicrobium aurantiacum]
MRFLFFCLANLLLSVSVFAQNENDVLRYSTTDVFGSARFEAMAGSFGALGADFSAIQINPASMGRFSSSKVSISFNNSFIQTNSTYNDTRASAEDNKFTVGSVGAVFTTDLSKTNTGKKFGQLSIGYTRLKNFHNTKRYEGQNFYSLLDVFANSGYGIDPQFIYTDRPFTTGLAYDVYAIDYLSMEDGYASRLTDGDMYHNREINTGGGIGEFHIGYSENYRNKLYYGASLGIRRIKYDESYNHNETLLDTVGTTLQSFNYTYDQVTRGLGVNLKLGLIYLPTDQWRFGLAFESPTMLNLEDEWTADMTATHDYGVETIAAEYVPTGYYEYRMKTPMKLRGSFAYTFLMRGAINVDLEMSRLPGGKLRADETYDFSGYNFSYENEEVQMQFRTVLNTRVGVEYMVYKDLFLRGGIAVLPQPYKEEIGNVMTPNMTYSGGIGWDNQMFAVDFSYRLLRLQSDYYAFDASKIENKTEFVTDIHNFVLTARFKF